MESTGMIKQIDSHGRVLIPREIRIDRDMYRDESLTVEMEVRNTFLYLRSIENNDRGLKGYKRSIDPRGRLVIPTEIRKKLDLNIGDDVEIFTDDEYMVVHSAKKTCALTGTQENLIYIPEYGQYISKKALQVLKDYQD